MGNKSEQQIRQEVLNEINLTIVNVNKQLNSLVNTTMTDIVTNISQSASAEININTSGGNDLDLSNTSIKGSNFSQKSKSKIENNAIIKIMTDNSALTDMISKINNDLSQKVTTNNNLQNSLGTLQKLSSNTTNAGGPEGMVKTVLDTINKLLSFGNSDSSNIEMQVRNQIRFDVVNDTTTRNMLNKNMTNAIETTMKQMAKGACNFNTENINRVLIEDATVNKFNLKQDVSLTAFNNCLIDLNLSNKIINQIVNNDINKNVVFSDAATKQKTDIESENINTKSVENKSAIMETIMNIFNKILNPTTMMIIVGALIAVIVLYLFFTSKGSSDINDDNFRLDTTSEK